MNISAFVEADIGTGPIHGELRGGVRSFRLGQRRIYYLARAERLTVVRQLQVSMDVVNQFG